MSAAGPRGLPRLYDSSDDLAFDEDRSGPLRCPQDEDEVTLPDREAATGIRSFFDTVVRELEDTERRRIG